LLKAQTNRQTPPANEHGVKYLMNKETLCEHWQGYTIIKSISFETNFESGDFECALHLVLTQSEYAPEDQVKIKFIGVANLKVGEIGGGISQICQLDIDNIKDRQWAGLNYYVFDSENEVISFNCRDLEILDTKNI
jgi:hypothetical protein